MKRNRAPFAIALCIAGLFSHSCQEEEPIKVTGITINPTSLSLKVGETVSLTATVSPKDAENQTVIWFVADGSVVSLSNGIVTALKAGNTTVTAKSDDGGYTATCSVIVNNKAVSISSITISPSTLVLKEGESSSLTATVSPAEASEQTIIWASSNTAVATVTDGNVTAVAEGSATITAKAGDKSAACDVTVKKAIVPVESVTLDVSSLELAEGETVTLAAIVKPDEATNKAVNWSSNNTNVATVSSSGVVSAKAAGNATITVKTNDGNKTATCVVTVVVPVTGVSLNYATLTLTEGQTQTLTATVSPSNATNKNVTWSSNNTTVATVSTSGIVTAKAAGSATITVTTNDKGKKATCSVCVNSAYSTDGNENGYDYVDLGLPSGVKWATCNVGASKPEDYGSHYAWGETEPKSNYNWIYQWSTYIWCNGSQRTLTKYCDNSSYGYNGFIDNKTFIDSEDDAAHVNWGGRWRMPTNGDWTELLNNCAWIWTKQNNVYGYKVVSKIAGYRDKSIFLPAAGLSNNETYVGASKKGYYWSFNLLKDLPYYAYCFLFNSDDNRLGKSRAERPLGMSVRPVIGPIPVESLSLDHSAISMKERDTFPLNATVYPSTASNVITWTSSNTSVASVSGGLVTALKAGTTTITAKCEAFTAQCEVTVIGDFVDLGLSVKWATCNLGAYWPWIYGSYFAWGEISTKSVYDRFTYKWDSGSQWANYKSLTRYCPLDKSNYWGGSGEVDGKTCFKDYDYADDAARKILGGTWRIPTEAEWRELKANCNLTYTQQNGIYGLLVTSRKPGYTNKSIFFPFSSAGIASSSVYGGYYWSSSLYLADPVRAFCAIMGSGSIGINDDYRVRGLVVRPVCD